MHLWFSKRSFVKIFIAPILLLVITGCGASSTITLGQTPVEFTQQIDHLTVVGGEISKTVPCPPGTALVSGGYAVDTQTPLNFAQYLILNSYPSDATGTILPSGQQTSAWTVRAQNTGTAAITMTISANCVKGTGIQTVVYSKEQDLSPPDPDEVTIQPMQMTCPTTTYPTITGGGFAVRPANSQLGDLGDVVIATYPTASEDLSTQTWQIGALAGIVREFVVCAKGLYLNHLSTTTLAAKTDAQNQIDGMLQCPDKTILVGGGYSVIDPRINSSTYFPVITNATGVPDFTAWHVGGKYTAPVDSTQSAQIDLSALCDAGQPLYK